MAPWELNCCRVSFYLDYVCKVFRSHLIYMSYEYFDFRLRDFEMF